VSILSTGSPVPKICPDVRLPVGPSSARGGGPAGRRGPVQVFWRSPEDEHPPVHGIRHPRRDHRPFCDAPTEARPDGASLPVGSPDPHLHAGQHAGVRSRRLLLRRRRQARLAPDSHRHDGGAGPDTALLAVRICGARSTPPVARGPSVPRPPFVTAFPLTTRPVLSTLRSGRRPPSISVSLGF